MGAAKRYAEKHSLTVCFDCKKPFDEDRRPSCIRWPYKDPVDPNEIGEAVCQWCDLKASAERHHEEQRRKKLRAYP